MAPGWDNTWGDMAATPIWVDVNSTVSATEPTSFLFRRRTVRYYSNSSTTYIVRRRRTGGSTGGCSNEKEKKLLAKKRAKQILDKKSKEGVRKINFNSILKPQVEKKQLFLNHKINSNRGG